MLDQWIDGQQGYLGDRSLSQDDFEAWCRQQPKNILAYEAKKKRG